MKADRRRRAARSVMTLGILGVLGLASGAADAAVRIDGQVQAGGGAVANSTVTLWAGGVGDAKQLGQAKTSDDGSFTLSADEAPGPEVSLYLIAKGGVPSVNKSSGDNPALTFLAVLGGNPPTRVTINEMTTVASVWTNAQFLDGAAIKGPALSLSIAAGNAPNFVDFSTGGWGGDDPGPAQQRADADDGQFRHAAQTRLRAARRGLPPSLAKSCSRRRSRHRARRQPTR